MHSTWPVYAQPDERQTTKDGMTLSVSRRRTCLATAGDQITMQATLFTDFPVSLKSFELALIQRIIYPTTATTVGKRGPSNAPPPSRSSIISEQKRPQPARIQPGMHQTCELICMLPPNYSAMTVNTARLIENVYEVHVSAILEGDNSISVGLPVTVSPFPVPYSMDMMQRMGMPPMALDHPSRAHLHQQAASISRPASAAASMLSPQPQDARTSQYAPPTTAPPGRQQRPFHIAERVGGQAARDDSLLGGPPSPTTNPPVTAAINTITTQRSVVPDTLPVGVQGVNGYNEFGQQPPSAQRPPEPQPPQPLTVTSPGPQTARFAVVNLTQRDEPDSPRSSVLHEPYMTAAEEKRKLAQQMRQAETDAQAYAAPPPGPPPSGSPATASSNAVPTGSTPTSSSTTPPKKKWLSAEEEKEKLFQKARDAAELTQRRAANSSAASASTTKAASPKAQKFNEGQTSTAPAQSPSSPAPATTPVQKSSTSSSQKWTSAEEEKRKLYERAQSKAMKTQAKAAAAGSAANVTRSNSIQSQNTVANGTTNGTIVNPYTFTQTSTLKGADLYKSAMSNIKAPAPSTSQPSSSTQKPPSIQESITPPPTTPPAQITLSAPITPPPPSVTPSRNNSGWMSAEDEKARLRYLEAKRAVERHTALQDEDYGASSSAVDNGAYLGSNGYAGYASHSPSNDASWNAPPSSPPPSGSSATPLSSMPPAITPPPSAEPPAFEPSYGYTHATDIPEKEKIRLAMEARDAQMDAPGYDEPPPAIPGYNSGPSVQLSAAEEKARLRAQYASDDNVGGSGSGVAASSSSNTRADLLMSADGGRMLTPAEEKARQQAMQAAERPISSVAPLPPPRIKSPPPSAPLSSASEFARTPASSSYLSSPTVSVSSDDHLRRDPSIAQGKQRAMTPSNASANGTFVAPPPPPPLAPRPPKDYIRQTKEQDAKIRRMTQETINLASYGVRDTENGAATPWKANNDFSLGLRPFSPFNPSLDAANGAQAGQGSSSLANNASRNFY
ncbi:hypothetical protein FRC17_005646 [Serendipita sp. 399]|nr:hypothetical protein FRC17_005646 [Serendipita sp. 399]